MKATYFLKYPLICLLLSGCVIAPQGGGDWGYGPERRKVIVGENVTSDIADFYQRKYDAKVWFSAPQGLMKDSAQVILKGLGPSKAMRSLIGELNSINYSFGRWEFIVPKIGEEYFLTALKYMPRGSLANARGDIVLIDSKGNKDMEEQIARVSNHSFFVTYEFQKY